MSAVASSRRLFRISVSTERVTLPNADSLTLMSGPQLRGFSGAILRRMSARRTAPASAPLTSFSGRMIRSFHNAFIVRLTS